MKKALKSILVPVVLLILILFVLFVINQTVQVVALAETIHPLLGQILLWVLLAVYLALVSIPVIMYLRLPQALVPPDNAEGEEFERFLERLAKRLRRNIHLEGQEIRNREQIEAALKSLNLKANQIIKANSSTVFVTTAISQSGRLDAFTVLIAQIRMVWQVAKVYNQRPSLREMGQLYANVAATTFIAGELDDLNISEQVEPIIGSVLGGSLTSAIPGVHTVANIITTFLLTGAANAYLTLRVGAISKQYCGSLIRAERKIIRRSATVEAARMLSLIVMNSAGNISRAIVNAAMKRPGKLSKDIFRSTWGKISGKSKDAADIPGEFPDPL